MSGEDFALIALAESTKAYVKVAGSDKEILLHRECNVDDGNLKGGSIFHRVHNRLRLPKMTKLRSRLRKMNCFKAEEEELIMMETPRNKSIDIGVGFGRRMSLFLFTKRSVCLHPYHPFTPKQTTRKIHLPNDD